MSLDKRFDDIRPYTNDEIPAAMKRLASEPLLDKVFRGCFPDSPYRIGGISYARSKAT